MGITTPRKYFKKSGIKKEIRTGSSLTRTLSPQEKKFVQHKISSIKGLVSKRELKGAIKKLRQTGKISKIDKKKLKKLFGIKRIKF